MTTLDMLVFETLKRIQAAGGSAWIAPDSTDQMKLAFLEMLMDSPECRRLIRTNGSTFRIDTGRRPSN